jgi:hypothetical protein
LNKEVRKKKSEKNGQDFWNNKDVILYHMRFCLLFKKGVMVVFFKKPTMTVGLFVLLSIILPNTAHAYLDPGTGSYFLQMAIATLLSGLYAIKLFWKNIKAFFRKIFSRGKTN